MCNSGSVRPSVSIFYISQYSSLYASHHSRSPTTSTGQNTGPSFATLHIPLLIFLAKDSNDVYAQTVFVSLCWRTSSTKCCCYIMIIMITLPSQSIMFSHYSGLFGERWSLLTGEIIQNLGETKSGLCSQVFLFTGGLYSKVIYIEDLT